MKQLTMYCLLVIALTFANTASAANKVLIPSFQVKVNNYSSVANQNLKVKVYLDCSYTVINWGWSNSKSCGNQLVELTVNKDGTFVVPNLNYLQKSSIKNYSLSVDISSSKGQINFIVFSQDEIKKAAKKLAEISIVELPDVNINVVTRTGEDYATWRGTQTNVSGIPTGPCVLLNLIWISEANGFTGSPERDGETDTDVAGFLKGGYLVLPGNTGKDIQVRAELSYWSSKNVKCVTNVSPARTVKVASFKDTIQNIQAKIQNSTVTVD